MPKSRAQRPCEYRICLPVPERRANALNIEIGAPLPRCKLKLPDHWTGKGASANRWLTSGGSPLVFGHCNASCPLSVTHADAFRLVIEALSLGLVLHAVHPDFGGTLTAGPVQFADGQCGWATIQHGGTIDVGFDGFTSVHDLSRGFIFQVGKHAAHEAAVSAIAKASGP